MRMQPEKGKEKFSLLVLFTAEIADFVDKYKHKGKRFFL